MPAENFISYLELRKEFPFFIYESYSYFLHENSIRIRFEFNLSDRYFFHPEMHIPFKDSFRIKTFPGKENKQIWDTLVFHIGMIELISYWKAACPPDIIIKPHRISDEQVSWWKKLYYFGLGEFFYTNSIKNDIHDFVNIISGNGEETVPIRPGLSSGTLIPVGGGKDSAVTLELLKKNTDKIIAFAVNPGQAILRTAEMSGLNRDELVEFHRTIDPELLKLNQAGFLNGHTPFSALLAFNTLVASYLTGFKNIALSNESSANESTVPGTMINHQYSKSYGFESDFRYYVNKYISPEFNYFSFLRPLSELQIAGMFSQFSDYHPVFRSCNAGSKKGIWCGACSKCLFTFIILSPFLNKNELLKIFGKDLLDDLTLKKEFDELTGLSDIKPFECVGTPEEINLALIAAIKKRSDDLPALLKYYIHTSRYAKYKDMDSGGLFDQIDHEHHLESRHLEILIQNINRHTL